MITLFCHYDCDDDIPDYQIYGGVKDLLALNGV
jgi:hypothetical protein